MFGTLVRPFAAYYVISVRRFRSLPAKAPHLDIRLPSDSTSRWTPLPSANASYCRARSGLSPPSCCPCRAHYEKRTACRQSFLQIFAEFTELFSVHRCTGRRRHLLDGYTGFPLRRIAWPDAVSVDCCFYGRDCNQQKCGQHDGKRWERHERTHSSCNAGTGSNYDRCNVLNKDFGQTIQQLSEDSGEDGPHPNLLPRACGGAVVSAALLQSPASSDCAFIPVGCSVSSRYTFPYGLGSAFSACPLYHTAALFAPGTYSFPQKDTRPGQWVWRLSGAKKSFRPVEQVFRTL